MSRILGILCFLLMSYTSFSQMITTEKTLLGLRYELNGERIKVRELEDFLKEYDISKSAAIKAQRARMFANGFAMAGGAGLGYSAIQLAMDMEPNPYLVVGSAVLLATAIAVDIESDQRRSEAVDDFNSLEPAKNNKRFSRLELKTGPTRLSLRFQF